MGVITRVEHYIWYLQGAYSQVADQARHYMWWLKNMEVILSTAVFSVSSVSPPRRTPCAYDNTPPAAVPERTMSGRGVRSENCAVRDRLPSPGEP